MKKKYSKEDILDIGIELFREKGYNNTGIDVILKSSGIPKGSFYNFFSSKEEFALEALKTYSTRIFLHTSKILNDSSVSPLERIERFYNTSIEMHTNEDCKKGCLLANITMEMSGQNESFSRQTDKHHHQITNLIAACVAEGQVLGEINDNIDATELALFMYTGFNGAVLRSKAGRCDTYLKLFIDVLFKLIKK